MYKYFIKLFSGEKKKNIIFTKEYRQGYNKLWINNIKNYTPL
jgi:hypothetical protein